jgi:ribonuclease P protein component
MLARENRLPASTRLIKSQFARTPLFSLKFCKNTLTVSRFAFVVRKSVDKRAVVRNRIRRLLRSCIEELKNNIVPGYDMLFFLEKGIIDKQQEELCKELQAFLQQKKLIS